ncbi:MAG TPA: type II toxin-antitoxin system VapC family toxin [Acidimicrobiales bacterium]|nr:MAG: type II toxin-antitoxin system VapC family toxin [Chloroflexota bacterium]HMC39026.1 type II toxin-antitoxin system VapC family toxin [Acidimicrobiales bacterium]
MSVVLDASAVICLLHDEPGADQVRGELDGARMSAVNWTEVLQKVVHAGDPGIAGDLEPWAAAVGLSVSNFTVDDARVAARLRAPTRELGLSLGDRACLALAERLAMPVLTADRVWAGLSVASEIRVIR